MRGLEFLCRMLRTGLAAAALVGTLLVMMSGPARAARQNATVDVTPNAVEPGGRVNIRANCDDINNRQATVESDAFGRVMLRPDNNVQTGSATVPGNKPPGQYSVNLTCANGNTASTTLTVVNMAKPSQGPATGGGGTAGGAGPLVIAGGVGIVLLGLAVGLFGRRHGNLPG